MDIRTHLLYVQCECTCVSGSKQRVHALHSQLKELLGVVWE